MRNSIDQIIELYLHAPDSSDKTAYTKEKVQSLWSGYGEITRYSLPKVSFAKHNDLTQKLLETEASKVNVPAIIPTKAARSLIAKVINLASQSEHPRGWQSDISHQRKLSSYQNECLFYQAYAAQTNACCAVPKLMASGHDKDTIWLIMEDLNARGLCERYLDVDLELAKLCIHWLANFHACFMQKSLTDLWPIGTYWHLSTRPKEFQKMADSALKSSAALIDQQLNSAVFQTLVHGDAKLANFCFHANNRDVAAVDFQYTGRGVGVKDLVYFLGSCFGEDALALYADELTDLYFSTLVQTLTTQSKPWEHAKLSKMENEWRELVPFAWADFERFLVGWAPSHKKLNGYSYQQTVIAVQKISSGSTKKI